MKKFSVEKIITTTESNQLEITEATLLTLKEAETLSSKLLRYDAWWWLQTPGYGHEGVVIVDTDAWINIIGYFAYYIGTVRPALKIKNLKSSNFKIGDEFIFNEKKFEIIDNETAFCLEDIGCCKFRRGQEAANLNDYSKSDVKSYIEDWFNTCNGEK